MARSRSKGAEKNTPYGLRLSTHGLRIFRPSTSCHVCILSKSSSEKRPILNLQELVFGIPILTKF